jgi:arginyl-tRNA synthetase
VTSAALADLVRSVARGVLADHGLDPGALPDTVTVHRPRDPRHGDYATNLALQAGKRAGVTPRDLAGWLAHELAQHPEVCTVEVAGPGFVNLRLTAETRREMLAEVLAAGQRFEASHKLPGCRITLDAVPVHTTGPLQLIDARQVVVGDALGRMLTFAGAAVTRSDPSGVPAPGMVNVLSGQLTMRGATMAHLVEAIGVDAARYALIRCSYTAPITVDLNIWSKWTDDNPLFRVQYAHARLVSLARNAADLGISSSGARLGLLDGSSEAQLICMLGEFAHIVVSAGARREPHRVARYLEQLAGTCHNFSNTCRVLPMGDETPGPLHAARLALCRATRQVLANGLDLLGVSAPEQL